MRYFLFYALIIGTTSLFAVNMNLAVEYLEMPWLVDGPNIWNHYTETNDPHQGYTEDYPCDWVDSIADTLYGMPYHYGGKDSFSQWNNDYVNGSKGPGAHSAHWQASIPNSLSWAAGIDCSGFVGRCWEISDIWNCSCDYLAQNSTAITSTQVQSGAAFIRSSYNDHARLCYGRNENDPTNQWVEVIEATGGI